MTNIITQLNTIINRGYNHFQVFNDWLDLMLFALMKQESLYLQIVRKYPNDRSMGDREIDYFAKAFALLMKNMKETQDDILGEIYMNLNLNHQFKGQFFTPKHIACLMAQITKPRGNICDPACGSGIMMIEACKQMSYEDLNQAFFVAQDIDETCVKMCALNLCFFNLNAYIICGDSLVPWQFRRAFRTTRSYLGGLIRELTDEELDILKTQLAALSISSSPPATESQLILF